MNKKISGSDEREHLDDVRERIRRANSEFTEHMQAYANKKGEYHEIKKMNDLEREQIRKEQKMANSFKFTKMSKRVPFLPALHTRGFMEVEPVTSVDKGTNYMNFFDR